MIYVVLGMHKSGTTLVSQILHHSGINMGCSIETHCSYDQGNKYERAVTLCLNEEILDARPNTSVEINVPSKLSLTTEQRGRMREIIESCNREYDNWGFKDPRTCLVYPLWASELPTHKIIAVYRSPHEIWPRYRVVHSRNRYRDPYRAWRYVKTWCEHNHNVVTFLKNTGMDYIVLEYGRLMATTAEFNRLQEFVDMKLDDRRKPELYRNRDNRYRLVDMAGWLVHKQKGYHPQTIMEQLKALRQRS